MLQLFTIPSASNVVASSSDYATTFTTAFLPLLGLAVGLAAAAILVAYVIKKVKAAMRRVSKHR